MKKPIIIALSLLIVGGLTIGMAQDAMAGHELIGAAKCKSCHKKIGDPYKIWMDSAHSKAFETLGTDAAKAIATEKGLGDPQKEEACLKCHTSHGFLGRDVVVNAKGKYEDAEGVGCEACHGPGSEYKSKKVMMDHDAAVAAGMIMDKSEAHCTKCHNADSPTYKAFDFKKQWDAIKHPVVAKAK